jgi:hypothetical protein
MEWTKSVRDEEQIVGVDVGKYRICPKGMLYKKIEGVWCFAEDRSNPQECKDPLVSLITCLDAVRRDTE